VTGAGKTADLMGEGGDTISREVLAAEVRCWGRRIGVANRIREIHLRPMRRKWASCSSRGRVTLDPELLCRPAEFRARVIVHELLHLKIPNHGPLFRNLLNAYLRRYRHTDGAPGT